MAAPILTWGNLFTFKFPTPPRYVASGIPTTASYTARDPPSPDIEPRYSIPDRFLPTDQQILTRVLDALHNGLAVQSDLPPFPDSFHAFSNAHLRKLEIRDVASESKIVGAGEVLVFAVESLVQVIFDLVAVEDVELVTDPPTTNSQRGGLYISVIVKDKKEKKLESTVSVAFKKPDVLFALAATMASKGQHP
jgi:hypothetical protein